MNDAEPPAEKDPAEKDKTPRIAELVLEVTTIGGLFTLLFALLYLAGALQGRAA